ncbi:MAG TPA: hypothetical protein VFX28_22065, partial [Methylomirabilota bacterium]|nr:hypothetical protein [Methylomirabilota bacterium]
MKDAGVQTLCKGLHRLVWETHASAWFGAGTPLALSVGISSREVTMVGRVALLIAALLIAFYSATYLDSRFVRDW